MCTHTKADIVYDMICTFNFHSLDIYKSSTCVLSITHNITHYIRDEAHLHQNVVHLDPGVELGELEADGEVLSHVLGLGVHLHQTWSLNFLFVLLTAFQQPRQPQILLQNAQNVSLLHLHDPEVVCDDLPGLGVLVQPEVELQLGLQRDLRLVRIQLLALVEILKNILTLKQKYFHIEPTMNNILTN